MGAGVAAKCAVNATPGRVFDIPRTCCLLAVDRRARNSDARGRGRSRPCCDAATADASRAWCGQWDVPKSACACAPTATVLACSSRDRRSVACIGGPICCCCALALGGDDALPLGRAFFAGWFRELRFMLRDASRLRQRGLARCCKLGVWGFCACKYWIGAQRQPFAAYLRTVCSFDFPVILRDCLSVGLWVWVL